jgi:hypothetical protein
MRGPIPRVVEWFITLLVCVLILAFTSVILIGVSYLSWFVFKNMGVL